MTTYADAIAGIESGGDYGILGPATKSGDRAYGKYQIMGDNIPQWTKEILGISLTPDQFLKNPEAQEQVFQGKFGQYVQKYGPDGAARAWFAGPGNMNNPNAKDANGMDPITYGQRFHSSMLPPLPQTNIGSAPPIAGPQMPQLAGATPASQPQQTPQQMGGGSIGANNPQQQQLPMLSAQGYRPFVNPQIMQQVLANLPKTLQPFNLKPYSFSG